MLLAPRRVGHFGDDGLDSLIGIEAVVEADRIHREAEVAEVRQQPNRTSWPLSGASRHQVADRFGQRLVRRPEMVAATKPGQVRSIGRPQPAATKQRRQFVQIDVQQEQSISETRDRPERIADAEPRLRKCSFACSLRRLRQVELDRHFYTPW